MATTSLTKICSSLQATRQAWTIKAPTLTTHAAITLYTRAIFTTGYLPNKASMATPARLVIIKAFTSTGHSTARLHITARELARLL